MAEPDRVTVYYNSACPVCDAGIRSQRGRMAGCDVQWVDVHAQNEAARAVGAPLEDVRKRLHVTDSQGRVLVGAEALAELWSRSPGQRWLARVVRLRGLRWLAGHAYDLFAEALYRWNRRRGHW
jgi:predicted DCC family thiol-disulfide oxidoreductase YuxK